MLTAAWFLISVGFGQPTGGIVMGEYDTRAQCEIARPSDCCERVEGEPDSRVEYACVPGEFVWRWRRG